MREPQKGSGRGFDRSYRRGAIMGLTVAEAFILLAFCLLLLFTWWQVDTEQKSLIVAEKIAELSPAQKAVIVAGLSDGSFDAALALRKAGIDLTDKTALVDAANYSRFIREEDFRRLMSGVVKLSPNTRLSLASAIEVNDEVALRAMLATNDAQDATVQQVAAHLENAARQKTQLVSLIDSQLGDTIRAAGGSIDASGTISLPQSILFDANGDRIKDPAFLLQICAPWLESLKKSGLKVSELKIEGHASSEGLTRSTPEQAYLFNLDLSQRRAQNALEICLTSLKDPAAVEWARQHLAAVGYSSARLIRNADGSEDREASRRVMFSVSLDQEDLIDDIKRDVTAPETQMSATGPARVIDGDTIEINGTSFRISGIDAPERGQGCVAKDGTAFDCGAAAKRGLELEIAGRPVDCTATEIDFYRRPIATCVVAGVDIAEGMITKGFAVPFEEYSDKYVKQGEIARSGGVGIWNTTFQMPWDYRQN